MRYSLLVIARLRLFMVIGIFVLAAAVALVRIGYLGFAGAPQGQTTLEEALLPPRGEIADRNGAPLARTFPAYALWFNPRAMEDDGSPLVAEPREVAERLKAIFPDLDIERTVRILTSDRGGYLLRRLLPEDANKVFDLGEVALELPRENDRYYPQGPLGAHVLGYALEGGDRQLEGKLGMEQVLDDRLSNPLLRAEPVALSIDLRVQGALEDELGRGMLATNAKGAAGIVLDVDTGEVMAMASLPAFDPNRSDAQHSPNIYNRATNATYELGSTFKPLTVAAAIDAGIVRDLGAEWDAGPVEIGHWRRSDLKPKGDTLNVAEALAYSSNTVTMRIADALGEARMRQVMTDLGMNRPPQIELPARGRPQWPQGRSNGSWSRITTMTVGYGHGIAVTPLHLASAYAAMVNGGVYRPATLHRLEPGEAPRGTRVFKASTSSRMRQLMRMISIYGTGRSADAAGYRVGGKTGSAEKARRGGYAETALISSFAAAFPMERPRYVVVTVLDEPKGTAASSGQRTAAYTAAPIVGALIPRIGPMLDVRPDAARDVDISDLRSLIEGRR
ncbi:peptidoglycan D,D-transpeptidase FtsI family protein [Qipengyuania nanhaisediminis]|uniref:peptidoglycan D,D-transpeptidase FtsI family protein n=1 Tax=Qipengyuania nanhaisediminis TaxID=604088 RepID=UPI0038B30EBD